MVGYNTEEGSYPYSCKYFWFLYSYHFKAIVVLPMSNVKCGSMTVLKLSHDDKQVGFL